MKFNKKILTETVYKKRDLEDHLFWILFMVMAVYYGWRMFALTPWYDELYTYYYFISRGPVYAGIHWPVPNNHLGYSVLSALVNYTGNPYLGLRAVSTGCALLNLYLVFSIGQKLLGQKSAALISVVLYLSMNLVNQMAAQGRGYTLGITCLLLALCAQYHILTDEKPGGKYYAVYILSLAWSLYTLTSDVYFVAGICLTGGCFQLLQIAGERKAAKPETGSGRSSRIKVRQTMAWKRLKELICASAAAAVLTAGLYSMVWLAIGSNLLVKDEGSRYYGMGHIRMLLKAPFAAWKQGMSYMLATPYIQSISGEEFRQRFGGYLWTLLNWYYEKGSFFLTVLILTGLLLIIGRLTGKGRKPAAGNTEVYFLLYIVINLLGIPLFLILQSTLPYYRVFTYGAVPIALLLGFWVRELLELTGAGKRAALAAIAVTVIFSVECFIGRHYQEPYSIREVQIQDALEHSSVLNAGSVAVTDCTSQYLIKFLYGREFENTGIEGADYVLLDKRMQDPEWKEMVWEFYHYYDTIPWDYVNREMIREYENDAFTVFVKSETRNEGRQ